MYKTKLTLTNPHRIPLALSNDFEDTFGLCDAVAKCRGAKQFCAVANKFYGANREVWFVDNDSVESTRLIRKDSLGNITYLIAYKEPCKPKSKLSSIPDADLISELITRGYKVSK